MAEIEQLGRFMIYKLGALWAEYFFWFKWIDWS